MATPFEEFVNRELPRRAALLTVEIAGYDGDPNDGGAPAILQNAPAGTQYQRGSGTFYRKRTAAPGMWNEDEGGESVTPARTTGNITLAVNGSSGSDDPTPTRPEIVTEGDHSSEPFETIQAAVDSVARDIFHSVIINVVAGDYAGFNIRGFNAGAGSFRVNGAQAQVTPTTGPATGTASSGSVNTLTLTGAGWTADDFVGKFCRIISGQGAGQHFIIATNTTDTLTFAARMSPAPNNTSVFEITEPTTRLISNDSYFYSGFHHGGCIGSFRVEDFHVEGPSYGVTQVWSNSILTLHRVTTKNCYYGFIGQESQKAAWNQIGSLGSYYHGIGYLAMAFAGNVSYDKGWLAINAGAGYDGVWVSNCKVAGCQGIYVKGCGNNGLGIWGGSDANFWYVTADNNVDGAWVSGSKAILNYFSASNNTKRGVATDYGGRIDLSGTIAGTGNGEWGANAGTGIDGLITLTSLPTLTGTLGDATVDGTAALTWATDFDEVNEYAYNIERGSRIVRAA